MAWAAVGAAALAAGASIYGGSSANSARSEQAERANAFSEYMYKHRYQMQMDDMRSAGLNPILSYKLGAPGGPSGQMAGVEDVISPAVNSALATKRLGEDIRLMRATADKTHAEASKARAEAFLTDTAAVRENQLLAAVPSQIQRAQEEASTAREIREIKGLEARQLRNYGFGYLGREASVVEGIWNRLEAWFNKAFGHLPSNFSRKGR